MFKFPLPLLTVLSSTARFGAQFSQKFHHFLHVLET